MNNSVKKPEEVSVKQLFNVAYAKATKQVDIDLKKQYYTDTPDNTFALQQLSLIQSMGVDVRPQAKNIYLYFNNTKYGLKPVIVWTANLYKSVSAMVGLHIVAYPVTDAFLDIQIDDPKNVKITPRIMHKGERAGWWVVIKNSYGLTLTGEFVSIEYINKIKKISIDKKKENSDKSAWEAWTDEMEEKTAIKKVLNKALPAIRNGAFEGVNEVNKLDDFIDIQDLQDKEENLIGETQDLKEAAKTLGKPASHNLVTGEVNEVEEVKVEVQPAKPIDEPKRLSDFVTPAPAPKQQPKQTSEEPPFNLGDEEA